MDDARNNSAPAGERLRNRHGWRAGKLGARPSRPTTPYRFEAGTHELGLTKRRPPLLLVPTGLDRDRPVPLIVLLHGAGAIPDDVLPLLTEPAGREATLVLAPKSEGPTWDAVSRSFGPDVGMIEEALEAVFDSFHVDHRRVAIAGFSDGASYALSLGLVNGLLFSDILAFSPGFMAPESLADKPRIFISHGTEDRVLPIERCSRRLAPLLRSLGYDVDYREFSGGHVVPADMVEAALARFLGRDL